MLAEQFLIAIIQKYYEYLLTKIFYFLIMEYFFKLNLKINYSMVLC